MPALAIVVTGLVVAQSNSVSRAAVAGSDVGTVAPARLLDTRSNGETVDGKNEGDGKVEAGSFTKVQIAGRGNVPADAVGVELNITSIQNEGTGFATLYPCTTTPPTASTLNFTPGVNIANATTVALNSNGEVCVYTSSTSHYALDVVAFIPAGSDVGTVAPARLLDTRSNGETVDGKNEGDGKVEAGSFTKVQIAGRGNVPADAVGVELNITSIQNEGTGFATLYPCTTTPPTASTLNFTPGVNIANATTVALNSNGEVCVYTSSTSHYALDVLAAYLPAVPPPTPIAEVALGYYHSCAVARSGEVYCWGSNSRGQLGDGTVLDAAGRAASGTSSATPRRVIGLNNAVAVAASYNSSCAVLDSGAVRCWGWNHEGQLGDGTTDNSSVPVDVIGLDDAVGISGASSSNHVCALRNNGSIACWGLNNFGQLGNGTTSCCQPTPAPVPVVGIDDASAVAVDGGRSCAIIGSGSVQCWGRNPIGAGNISTSATPLDVPGITDATEIGVSGTTSCAASVGGTIQCWGSAQWGQLGNDAYTTGSSTGPIPVDNITNAVEVSGGVRHNCAVTSEGRVHCWGFRTPGRTGGSTTLSPVPGIVDAIHVAAGGEHTCAVLDNGGVRCWGLNSAGQLGGGIANYSSTIPVIVQF